MFGTTQATFGSMVGNFIQFVINPLAWLLSGVAIVIFMFGLVRYVANGSNPKSHKEAAVLIAWSLLALFIIFSLGALIAMWCGFLGNAQCKFPRNF